MANNNSVDRSSELGVGKNLSPNTQQPRPKLKWLWWGLGIIILAAIAGGVYYYWTNNKTTTAPTTTATTTTVTPTTATTTPTPATAGQTSPTTQKTTTQATTTPTAPIPVTPDPTTSDWNTYTNSAVGFSFKYPKDAHENSSKYLSFVVTVNDINTMEQTLGDYSKANILKDKTALARGDASTSFDQALPSSLKVLNIQNALAKELTILQQFDVCNVEFSRRAMIYKDNSQIMIILNWQYLGNEIKSNNPSYFKVDSENCGVASIWKDKNGFYTDLVAGKTDAVSQKWFTDFNKVISTFVFTK